MRHQPLAPPALRNQTLLPVHRRSFEVIYPTLYTPRLYLVIPFPPRRHQGEDIGPMLSARPKVLRQTCPTQIQPSPSHRIDTVSYTHLRAHETRHDLVCRL